jgi:glycerate-2-kinase
LEKKLGKYLIGGQVNVLEGTKSRFRTHKIILNEAAHPVPNISGTRGARRMLKLIKGLDSSSLVICLISGGGSALMSLPAEGVALSDLKVTTELLLRSGADIDSMNCIRKHLSAIAGGQLLRSASGANFLSLIISDVVGDHLESIASGPTVPDPTTFSDAKRILENLRILDKVPTRVKKRIVEGTKGLVHDTPKPRDPIFEKVNNVILGANAVACQRMEEELSRKLGRAAEVRYVGSRITGEASVVARMLVEKASGLAKKSNKRYFVMLWGGETTVTVKGHGVGGRNQEEALSALLAIDKSRDRSITMGFMGTDGIDGNTNAAGAIVDLSTFKRAQRTYLEIPLYLRNNDSHSFFKKVGNSLVLTGPTGTNVNDIGIAICTKKFREEA